MVYVVGIGPGNEDYILPMARKTMENSDFVLGFQRAMDSMSFLDVNKKVIVKSLKEIEDFIKSNEDKNISITASGDPNFYGIVEYVKRQCCENCITVPGISSFQYLASRINKSWSGAHVGSLHGREEDFLKNVRLHRLSFWLTDKVNNPAALCEILHKEGIDSTVYVGENLSYDDEKIWDGSPKEFINKEFASLNVMVVERK